MFIPVILNVDNRYSGANDCRKISIKFENGSIELDILKREVIIQKGDTQSTISLGTDDNYIKQYGDKNAVGTEINRFLALIDGKDATSHISSLSNTAWIWDFVDTVNDLLNSSMVVSVPNRVTREGC